MTFKMEKPVMFSKDGYKRYSPDVNNKQNLIATGDITMKDVDFPVHGIDNEGNEKIMEPGKDYKFPGDVVLETPLNKNKNKMAFKLKSGNKTSFKMMGSSPMKQGEHEGVHGEKEEPESKQYPEQDTLSAASKIKASGSATAGETTEESTHRALHNILTGATLGASLIGEKTAETVSKQLKKKL